MHPFHLCVVWVISLAGLTGGRAVAGPEFSGEEAYTWVRRQVELGPRVPGSAAHAACLEMMESALDGLGIAHHRQPFRAANPLIEGDTLQLNNLFAALAPPKRPRLLLGAHWDTRPWSDEEPDSSRHHLPVPGANDGASGVAVLLTLARHFQENPPPIGIDLAFFDGEDLGRPGHPQEYALGSQHMAAHYPGGLPDYVLVLDMVGSVNLEVGIELFAYERHPQWVDLAFQVAESLGYTEWNRDVRDYVFDDHAPFLVQGIAANVIIGFSDPNWHTQADDLGAIRASSLAKVGNVVLQMVYGGYLMP